MTYAELQAAIEKLTPEQRAMPVRWCGEERGGEIDSLQLTDEDVLRDEGDSGELFMRSELEEDCKADPLDGTERLAAAVVTLEKGAPLLYTDGVADAVPLK